MGRLERHLDVNLIKRMDAGWKPHTETSIKRRTKPPREADEYRAHRRNAMLRGEVRQPWLGAKPDHEIHCGPNTYSIRRFGMYETRPLKYQPNGERECARRARRLAAEG